MQTKKRITTFEALPQATSALGRQPPQPTSRLVILGSSCAAGPNHSAVAQGFLQASDVPRLPHRRLDTVTLCKKKIVSLKCCQPTWKSKLSKCQSISDITNIKLYWKLATHLIYFLQSASDLMDFEWNMSDGAARKNFLLWSSWINFSKKWKTKRKMTRKGLICLQDPLSSRLGRRIVALALIASPHSPWNLTHRYTAMFYRPSGELGWTHFGEPKL